MWPSQTKMVAPCWPSSQPRSSRCGREWGGGGVLVFSESGQASTALAAAFLMADRGMTFDEAQRLIVQKREGCEKEVKLNRNLSRQLTTWAKWAEFPGLPDWMY